MPFVLFPTALGLCGVAWNERGATAFQLPEATGDLCEQHISQRSDGVRFSGNFTDGPAWLSPTIEGVQRHLEGSAQDFAETPIDWTLVSDFQRGVYRETQAIKPGRKKSYGEIARALSLGPAAARAVGVALATNPWPLLVPCHRVVSASDKMTGFSGPGGIRTKTRLLVLEGAEMLSE